MILTVAGLLNVANDNIARSDSQRSTTVPYNVKLSKLKTDLKLSIPGLVKIIDEKYIGELFIENNYYPPRCNSKYKLLLTVQYGFSNGDRVLLYRCIRGGYYHLIKGSLDQMISNKKLSFSAAFIKEVGPFEELDLVGDKLELCPRKPKKSQSDICRDIQAEIRKRRNKHSILHRNVTVIKKPLTRNKEIHV